MNASNKIEVCRWNWEHRIKRITDYKNVYAGRNLSLLFALRPSLKQSNPEWSSALPEDTQLITNKIVSIF